MAHMYPVVDLSSALSNLQFESKENKIIIESFSRIYVEIIEGYAKAHAWKVCVPSQVPWVRIPLSPPLIYFNYSSDIGLLIGVDIIGSNSSYDFSDTVFISFFSSFLSSG